MKLSDVTKEQLEDMYLVQHLTMQEVVDIYSVTRQAVLKALDRNGIDKSPTCWKGSNG